MKRCLRVALVFAIVVSALPLSAPLEAGRCTCPKIYAPVECARGKVYPNQCVADCKKAKDCVPVGLFAEPAESVEAPVCELPEVPEDDRLDLPVEVEKEDPS